MAHKNGQDDSNLLSLSSPSTAPAAGCSETAENGDSADRAKGRAKRGPNLTEDELRRAAAELEDAKVAVTVQNLYSRLNRGSMTTICTFVEKWRQEKRDREIVLAENSINREEVMRHAVELTTLAYLGNAEMVKQKLAAAHQIMNDRDQVHAAEIKKLCESLDLLRSANEKLNGELDGLRSELRAAKDRNIALSRENARLTAENEERLKWRDAQAAGIAELKHKLEELIQKQ